MKYPKMKENVCELSGKLDNGWSFNVSKLHSLIFILLFLIPCVINSIWEIPIVKRDEIMIPTNNKNPESSPEKREDITK